MITDMLAEHKIKSIEQPKPLALVVTFDINTALGWDFDQERIKEDIRSAIGPDCPPVIVLAPGMDMKAIGALDADIAHQLQRQTEMMEEWRRMQQEAAN